MKYQGYVNLGNLARNELLWQIENIRLSNGRKIQQLQSHGVLIILQRNLSREEMVEKRTGRPQKCFRTNGCEICSSEFDKKSLKFSHSYSNAQQSYPILSLTTGRYSQSGAFKNQTECTGRLGVLKVKGLLKLETASKHVSQHIQTFWISNSGPLYIQDVLSTSAIHSTETLFKHYSNRCNATVLEQNVSICFPPFESDKSNSEKHPSRKDRTNDQLK